MKKKSFLRLLSLLLVFVLLAGCGGAAEPLPESDAVQENISFTIPTFDPKDFISIATTAPAPSPEATADAALLGIENLWLYNSKVVANDIYPVKYVMIYNPNTYTAYYSGLNTGSLGTQIDVDLNKGGLDEEDEEPIINLSVSQDELNKDIPFEDLLKEGSKAGILITPYKVGDTKTFYCFDKTSLDNPRITRKFTCKYAGTNCNIWTAGAKISSKLIKDYGKQFDTYIYPNVVRIFGTSRFAANGGKVNLLFYPMPSGIGGCFTSWDLFSQNEVLPQEIDVYGLNTDHDILHINANLLAYEEMDTFMRSTMAHEFQHLICATNAFSTPNTTFCPTWINEAMSGYIEEVLFPGVKAQKNGHLSTVAKSWLIRNGQSMYNFSTYADDIGVYGSVYLYAEYLATLGGNDIFSKFHQYWRNSYSSIPTDATALVHSLPQNVQRAIDECTPYPSSISFRSADEKLMSKLTLQFYLELLTKDSTDPKNFSKIKSKKLIYNQATPAHIEGGGRIIVALQGDTFTVPADADRGMMYIGLDKDFKPVTAICYW